MKRDRLPKSWNDQPRSYEDRTARGPRVKTSTHVCTHPKTERRRSRAAGRLTKKAA